MRVDELLGKYGISVELSDEDGKMPADLVGPSDVAGLRWPDVVVVRFTAAPEYVLHEGVHLICARTLQDVEKEREELGLLQVERALARHLSRGDRRRVLDYQSITMLDMEAPYRSGRLGYAEVGDWNRPTRTSWWREGAARAVADGLLLPDGRPTWNRRRGFISVRTT